MPFDFGIALYEEIAGTLRSRLFERFPEGRARGGLEVVYFLDFGDGPGSRKGLDELHDRRLYSSSAALYWGRVNPYLMTQAAATIWDEFLSSKVFGPNILSISWTMLVLSFFVSSRWCNFPPRPTRSSSTSAKNMAFAIVKMILSICST